MKPYPLRDESQKYFGSYFRNGHPVGEYDSAPNHDPKCRAVYFLSIQPMKSAPKKAYVSNPVSPATTRASDDPRLGKFHHSIEIGLHGGAEDPEGRITCDIYSDSNKFVWNEKHVQKAFGAGVLKLFRVPQKVEDQSAKNASETNSEIKNVQPDAAADEPAYVLIPTRKAE
ncbi:hypothetical protein WDW86_21815 [Bdellovibrionota bacterium FG-2]